MDKNEFTSLTNDYLADSEEILEIVENHLFELEAHVGERPDASQLEDVLRQLHTFKGNSGLIGFPSLAEYTHGLEDISKTPALTQKLVQRGHSDETILKFLGGNYLRVFEQVWGH